MGSSTVDKARWLRQIGTLSESKLWHALRYQKLGVKFRRQEPIDHYIVDFCCFERRLVIEIDGGIHENPDQKKYDGQRESHLRDEGFRILRFRSEEVEKRLDEVIEKIKREILSPLPLAGEGEILS
ncbi:MAG: endonuclease domain-containing protein [Deltaproteobacteria bacterium]|nr:endonuclease domain-containing protein [Deltaproteobacteria bacterium]